MFYYVYRLNYLNTKEFYFGSRSCKCNPSEDTSYMGSMYTWKPDKKKLRKIILKSDFKNRETAILFEAELILKYIKDPLNRNYHIPSVGFHTNGMTTVKDQDGHIFSVSVDDPRYLNGELVGCVKGMTTVKDKENNFYRISVTDPRYLSGELVGCAKGTITVKDKENNFYSVSIDDPRYLSGELVVGAKGTVVVKDKEDNISQVSIDDPRYLSGELVLIWTGRKLTEEHKNKIKAKAKLRVGSKNSQFGTCWIIKDQINKKIKLKDLDYWLKNGWVKGRKINK